PPARQRLSAQNHRQPVRCPFDGQSGWQIGHAPSRIRHRMRQVIQVLVARRECEAPDHCADASNRFTSWALPYARGFTLADRYLVHQRCRPGPGDDSLESADARTVRRIRPGARSNPPRDARWIAPKDFSLEVAKERALFAGVRWPAQV